MRGQKFGNRIAAPYYIPANSAILHSLGKTHFSADVLDAAAEAIAAKKVETPYQLHQRANNLAVLEHFGCIIEQCNPPAGVHRIVRRNATIEIDGVMVSVLPEIVTENPEERFIAFTKLRFSKSKVSLDACEIILLLLHHYGQRQSRAGMEFDFGRTKIIDCFSKTVIHGHSIGRHRDQQLHRALAEIRRLWPHVEQKLN
ncbi:MAG: hypothetical protein IAE97_14225 [Chthoniobacterales bacterium]|nr:hypothetical protein [Chthoniobacterales bacterium]